MNLITRSDDERLEVRVYRNAPEGLVKAMEDINLFTASLRAALALAEEYKQAGLEASNATISLQAAVMKLEFAKCDLEAQVRNLEEYMLKGVAFRDALYEQLCRAKEGLSFYAEDKNWNNDVVDIGVGEQGIPDSSECARDAGKIAVAALSSSSTFPHDAELARLCGIEANEKKLVECLKREEAETKRLKEVTHDAIEFAIEGWAYAGEYFMKKWKYEEELAELRRRAGGKE